MPTPDTNGLPPFAGFEEMKAKINELVAKYNNLLVNLDSLNVVSLTADHVDTGTLDANLVRIRSDLTSGYIQIDGNGMVINNGAFNTFTADINGNVTMTRALIQSSPSSYPRVVMDPSSMLFGAFEGPNQSIQVIADDIGSSGPALRFTDGGGSANTVVYLQTLNSHIISSVSSNIAISTGRDIKLIANNVEVPSWSDLINASTSQTLQSALNAKATSGALTSSSGSTFLNGGIAPGTQLALSGGGSVTWSGISIPDHVHVQI